MMRCATIFDHTNFRARSSGCCLCLAILFLTPVFADAQPVVDDGPALIPQPEFSSGYAADSCPGQGGCGCSDYSAALSTACDSCATGWAGIGAVSLPARPRPAVRLFDYTFGDPGAAGECGNLCGGKLCGGKLCGGVGCGQFWNALASRRAAGAIGGILGGKGLGGGCGVLGCGGLGCGGESGPGAGYVGYREPSVRCGMPAPPYPVPYPVPTHVGYTRFTYPPMMPHHSLPHYRRTYSYRHAPGLSRTTVHWRPSIFTAFAKLHHFIELPR